jgi:hypothetical protein
MNLFECMQMLEEDTNFHMARLLILLKACGGRNGEQTVAGLTKLAKLDFLLRYPTYLERALSAKGKKTVKAQVTDSDRSSIESAMVRFKYGPWDFRYRRLLK